MSNSSKREDKRTDDKKIMPIIVIPDAVVFPNCPHQFDVMGANMINAVRSAVGSDRCLFMVFYDKNQDHDVDISDRVGVVSTITQIIAHPDEESVHVRIMGEYRAYGEIIDEPGEFSTVEIIPAEEVADGNDDTAKSVYDKIFNDIVPRLNHTDGCAAMDMGFVRDRRSSNYGAVIDAAAYIYPFANVCKQSILDCLSHKERAMILYKTLKNELEFAKLDAQIERTVSNNMDAAQRDYYLHEKIRVINEELGEEDSPEGEAEEYRKKIDSLQASDEVKEALYKECRKLSKLPFGSQEAAVIRGYVDVCLSLPWGIKTLDNLNVNEVERQLDRDHYGMDKVKERILELISVRALVPDIKGQIICLVGPPGVGKTSIARSIAEAMGRNYVRVSLGGVRDEAEIRGHRRTYLGSMPGRIVDAVIKSGSMNPLILLDEIDKLSNDYKGDPTSALLEVLDPEQNKAFSDHFLEIPLDLSEVLFITTANNIGEIPAPLHDRMEIIDLPSYTHEEKVIIAKKYLVPKQTERNGLSGKNVKISDTAISKLIDNYTREAGVRGLERQIASLFRKCAKKLVSGEADKISITARNLESYMGNAKYKREELSKKLIPGMVNGLAWTSVGGEMLEIEVAVMEGSGKIELTGKLGDVMQESAKAAMSCIRRRVAELGIDGDYYRTKDIHIHVPEGAVPKDGPSAGITMATAIVSALTDVSVSGEVAMTGEITLGGRVLAIGGLREKSMAALRAGIKKVIIPAANEPDIEEFSETVKNGIKFIPVKMIDEVFAVVFPNDSGSRKKADKSKSEYSELEEKSAEVVDSEENVQNADL